MTSLSIGSIRAAILVVAVIALALPALGADDEKKSDEEYESAGKALKNGDYGLTLRYRYEFVDDADFDKDAHASTLRTTLWYRSAGFYGLRAYLQFEDVSNLGLADDHDDTFNGIDDRPRIVDPPTTEINQVTLGYTGLKDTEIVAGRREIILDDARFVGNVLWRQNYQSYDAFYVTQGSIPRTKLTYAFLDDVNTVRGTSVGIDAHVVNANFDLKKFGTAVAYYYHLDFEQTANVELSSASLGASWQGKPKVGSFEIPFRVEIAQQEDVGSNPGTIDAGYRRAVVGIASDHWDVKLGYELLEGSPDGGKFSTPLATLFKFNGWADKFLNTPDNGLQDLYVVGTYGRESYSAILAYHSFDADTGGAHYGDELDFRFVYTAPWEQSFLFQFALFDGDEGFSDTDKWWVLTQYEF